MDTMESSPELPSGLAEPQPSTSTQTVQDYRDAVKAGLSCLPQREAFITAYVFGEPSLLSSLQDNGLTDVVLHALLVKDVPATREGLGSLPNVFSALCLNSHGLAAFISCKPFQRIFKVLLSPVYLPATKVL